MADWYGMSRSNYVRVKDPKLFRRYIEQFNASVIEKVDSDGVTRYGWVTEDEYGCVPEIFMDNWIEDNLSTEDVPGAEEENQEELVLMRSIPGMENFCTDNSASFSILDGLAAHLEDGEVMSVIEVGHEKARYCTALAFLIHSSGRSETINLNRMLIQRGLELFGAKVDAPEW